MQKYLKRGTQATVTKCIKWGGCQVGEKVRGPENYVHPHSQISRPRRSSLHIVLQASRLCPALHLGPGAEGLLAASIFFFRGGGLLPRG